MWTRMCLYTALLAAVPVFPQAISPVNAIPVQEDDQMATPPPISALPYPTALGTEERSNYLGLGMTFAAAYIDNLYPGYGHSIADTTYSILPLVAFDQSTSLRHVTITYSPGFTFYQPTSQLNEIDQSARLAYKVRLTPHSSLLLNDGFTYSSTSFSSGASGVGSTVTGSAQPIAPGVIAPFAKQLANDADGEFVLQMSRTSMIGASGAATNLHYPNQSEVIGLYDSSSHSGSGFYNHRISETQYIGAVYSYTQVFAYPTNSQSETRLQSISSFYTVYPKHGFSLSASIGPQHYELTEAPLPASSSWVPLVLTSIGWQGLHTSLAASYSQGVTAGGGLVGAFHSRNADATARWQISRTSVIGATADYAINKSVSPLILAGIENGHSVSGSATFTRTINRQLVVAFEYDRLHDSYAGIAAISNNPNSDRAKLSVSWEFTRPLGQ